MKGPQVSNFTKLSPLIALVSALLGAAQLTKVSAQVEFEWASNPIPSPAVLTGEQKLVSLDFVATYGTAYFSPSTSNPGDYDILTSPVGPGYAFHDAAVPGHYVVVFGTSAFDMTFEDSMGIYRLDVGGIYVYLTGNPAATFPVPGFPDPPVVDVDVVTLKDGSEAHITNCSTGALLYGYTIECYRTIKLCATFDFIGPSGSVVSGFPAPAGSTVAAGAFNGGNPIAADCSTVYSTSKIPGNAGEDLSRWGPAGGALGFNMEDTRTLNFAGRIANDMGMSVSQIVSVALVSHITEWFVVNGYVFAVVEYTVTQVCSSSNGFLQDGPSVITPGTVHSPPNGAMDNDDAAAIALHNAGIYTGAGCQ